VRNLTGLDIKFLLPELKELAGARIQKIYQTDKTIWIELHVTGQGTQYLYFTPGKIFLSKTKLQAPIAPGSFAMLLRKYLTGQKIIDITQPGFERILDIQTEHYTLHLELFSTGNAILSDKAGIIIHPLEKQHWKDRNIYPSKPYLYPPKILDPFEMGIQDYEEVLTGKKKQIVIFLAIKMGLSGIFAEEICSRAGIEKSTPCQDLTEEQVVSLRDAILSLEKRPVLINSEPYPIEMKTLGLGEPIPSFLQELDKLYLPELEPTPVEVDTKQQRILATQEKSAQKWESKQEDRKAKAQILQNNYDKVDSIIKGLNDARRSGLSWPEIKEKITKDPKLSSVILEIRENEGKAILDLE